jgi:broad specificity phosphatase PhoE
MNKEFYLVRHAESMGNTGMDGGYDPALSPLGYAQAKQCAENLKQFCEKDTLLFSSPFERCIMTAEAIAEATGLKVTIMPALHEYFNKESFPIHKIKLKSIKEKASRHHFLTGIYDDSQWWPEKNETLEDLKIRMAMFRNQITGPRFPVSKIVCVGHLPSLLALAEAMVPDEIFRFPNAGINKINYINGKFSSEFINELCLQD